MAYTMEMYCLPALEAGGLTQAFSEVGFLDCAGEPVPDSPPIFGSFWQPLAFLGL